MININHDYLNNMIINYQIKIMDIINSSVANIHSSTPDRIEKAHRIAMNAIFEKYPEHDPFNWSFIIDKRIKLSNNLNNKAFIYDLFINYINAFNTINNNRLIKFNLICNLHKLLPIINNWNFVFEILEIKCIISRIYHYRLLIKVPWGLQEAVEFIGKELSNKIEEHSLMQTMTKCFEEIACYDLLLEAEDSGIDPDHFLDKSFNKIQEESNNLRNGKYGGFDDIFYCAFLNAVAGDPSGLPLL